MRVDKEKLDKMLSMSDAELWAQICEIASSHGIKIPTKMPAQSEMSKIRDAMSNGSNIKLADAVKIFNSIKRGGK